MRDRNHSMAHISLLQTVIFCDFFCRSRVECCYSQQGGKDLNLKIAIFPHEIYLYPLSIYAQEIIG